ncbi:MAG: HlyC/CorC family transporter [Ruminococcaceae bacterium]|nr:HlyC/CorC family transporter [Oscillospiraceae bacterium]
MLSDYIPHIIIMAACLILSAYFSATETAFSTMSKTRLKTLAEKGNKRASLAVKLSDNYDKLLSTILIGNNIVNILLASLGTIVFIGLLKDEELGSTVSTAAITVVVLLVGEITPKTAAKNRPEGFAMFSAPFIQFLIWILTPISFLFNLWQKLVNKIFHKDEDAKTSQEELLMIVDEVEQEGSIDNDEGDLLRNAIEFTERKAEDILTHRVDLEGIPRDATKEEVAELFAETRFSRLLVYEDSIDKITGVIHLKDFYTKDGIIEDELETIITPPVYIHKTEKINELLKLLQTNKSHIAVVLDEYGGTLGIVTMEDILEELVGDIWDEHDEVMEEIVQLDETTYRVDCNTNLNTFCDEFDVDIESESATAISGWLMEVLDKLPVIGDSFSFEHLDIQVTETEDHRPTYIRVIVNEIEDEEDDAKKKDKDDKKDKEKDKDRDEEREEAKSAL